MNTINAVVGIDVSKKNLDIVLLADGKSKKKSLPNSAAGHQALLEICTALLQAEVNIVQAYPLLLRPRGHAAVALMVDNIEIAQETLAAKGFAMITEADLQGDD